MWAPIVNKNDKGGFFVKHVFVKHDKHTKAFAHEIMAHFFAVLSIATLWLQVMAFLLNKFLSETQ